jgi:hypothetical protein
VADAVGAVLSLGWPETKREEAAGTTAS